MRLDFLCEFEVNDNVVVVLADSPKDPDIRYGFVAVEKRVLNKRYLRPEHHKIED